MSARTLTIEGSQLIHRDAASKAALLVERRLPWCSRLPLSEVAALRLILSDTVAKIASRFA